MVYVYCMTDKQKWIPCDKDHPDAICKSLTDLPSNKVSLFTCIVLYCAVQQYLYFYILVST